MRSSSTSLRIALLAAAVAIVAGPGAPSAAGAASTRIAIGARVIRPVEVAGAAEISARLVEPTADDVVVDARGTVLPVRVVFAYAAPAGEEAWLTVLPDGHQGAADGPAE